MKKPWVAFVWSLVIPGAGLGYLGLWRAAVVNLCIAAAIFWMCFFIAREAAGNYIHYIWLVVAAGSAGLAHAWASRINQ